MADSQLHMVKKYCRFCSVTLFGMELLLQLQMNIQLRKYSSSDPAFHDITAKTY